MVKRKITKAILAFLLFGFGVSASAATYNSDLLVGFTVGDGSGTDVIYDIGKASTITNGQYWNLSSVLSGFNLSTVNWAVIGDNKTQQSATGTAIGTIPAYTVFTTSSSPLPGINGTGAWSPFDTATKTIYIAFIPGSASSSGSLSAGNANSWYSQTVSGTGTQYAAIAGANPNTMGAGSVALYEILDNNSAPVIVGYFTLTTGGVLSFTTNSPSSGTTPPDAGFTASPASGFGPLTVVLTDTSTGTITNWVWNFGDGTRMTNGASVTVTNSYASGNYSVTLIVSGPGGASTNTLQNYISVYPIPKITSPFVSNGKLIFSGTNCPANVQYRILTATNIATPIVGWAPVWTNLFSVGGTFNYTNSAATNKVSFYRLVSP